MNDIQKALKKKYDAISEKVLDLHQEQQDILEQMREVCSHTDTYEMQPDPYDYEAEKKFKCRDCFRVLAKSELPE